MGLCGGWDSDTSDTDTTIFGSLGGGHYSVIDGVERIYHPGTPGGPAGAYDYLYFISDPNSPLGPAGTEYNSEAVDNIGFTRQDFMDTVKGVSIWNYDYFL